MWVWGMQYCCTGSKRLWTFCHSLGYPVTILHQWGCDEAGTIGWAFLGPPDFISCGQWMNLTPVDRGYLTPHGTQHCQDDANGFWATNAGLRISYCFEFSNTLTRWSLFLGAYIIIYTKMISSLNFIVRIRTNYFVLLHSKLAMWSILFTSLPYWLSFWHRPKIYFTGVCYCRLKDTLNFRRCRSSPNIDKTPVNSQNRLITQEGPIGTKCSIFH